MVPRRPPTPSTLRIGRAVVKPVKTKAAVAKPVPAKSTPTRRAPPARTAPPGRPPARPIAPAPTSGRTTAPLTYEAPPPPVLPGPEALVERARRQNEANRIDAQKLLARAKDIQKQVGVLFYDFALVLRQLSAPALYTALGYGSIDALVEQEGLCSHTMLYDLLAILEAYPPEVATALGRSKCTEYILLAKATPEDDQPAELAREREGQSVRDIRAERRRIENRVGTPTEAGPVEPDAAERAAHQRADDLQSHFRTHGAPHATATAILRHGEWWLRVEVPDRESPALDAGLSEA